VSEGKEERRRKGRDKNWERWDFVFGTDCPRCFKFIVPYPLEGRCSTYVTGTENAVGVREKYIYVNVGV